MITSSPIRKVNSPSSTHATSSLSWCRWSQLFLLPAGTLCSNRVTLWPVSRPNSFMDTTCPDASLRCFPPPAGTTNPLVMRDSFAAARRRVRPLAGGNHHDLDLHLRVVQPGLDRRPGRRLAGHDPGVPYRVHGGEIGDVGQPDRRRQDLRLVAAALREQRIDLGQRLLNLAGDVLRRVLGDHAGAVDAVAQHARLTHARAGIDSPDVAHAWSDVLRLDCVSIMMSISGACWAAPKVSRSPLDPCRQRRLTVILKAMAASKNIATRMS